MSEQSDRLPDADESGGEKFSKSMRRIEQFRLTSAVDKELAVRVYQKASGLRRNQIAVNSWGFPFIPIPDVRTISGSHAVQTIPANAEDRYFGHPIFWIDPKLTEFDPMKESEESWSIRMTYLIMGFGFWDPDFNWINYLKEYGVTYTHHDVTMYRNGSSAATLWNDIPFLEEKDLFVPLEKIQDAYNTAIDSCQALFNKESTVFRVKQIEAISLAKEFVGNDPYDIEQEPNITGGFWDTQVWPVLGEYVDEYEDRMVEGANKFSDLVEDTEKAFSQFQGILAQMDKVTATLSIPVIRNCESNLESYTQIMAFLGLSMSQAEYREKQYVFDQKVSSAFSDNRRKGAMQEVAREAYEKYASCWRRMRLALANNYQIAEGRDVIPTYQLLEIEIVERRKREEEKRQTQMSQKFKFQDDED